MDFRFPAIFKALYPVTAEIVLARNISNIDEIESFVQKLVDNPKVNDSRVADWLTRNLRNYLVKDYDNVQQVNPRDIEPPEGAKSLAPDWLKKAIERGDKVYRVQLNKAFKDKIEHVIDYLLSDAAPDRVDRMTVPEALKQSDDWTRRLLKKKVNDLVAQEGEKVIKKYPNGYTWKEVISKDALIREGKLMGHCVGSYCEYVEKGDAKILSLRDKKNEPHCTIEVRPGHGVESSEVRQIKGKGNSAVIPEYQPYVRDLLKTELKDYDVEPGELSNIGMFNLDGKLHDVEDLKKNPKLPGKLVQKVFYNHMKKIRKIETQDDGIRIYAYPEDMVDMLGIGMSQKSLEPLREMLSGDGEIWFDVQMNQEDLGELYSSLEKKHPKTYKKLMKDLNRVAKANDEEDSDLDSGAWLESHEAELEPIYTAVFDALRDGWEVGTRDKGFRYAKGILTSLEWDYGAKIEEDDSTKGNELYWFVPFQSLVDENLGESNEDRVLNRREGYDSEFDSDVAKEYFYERLREQDYTVD